MFSDTKHAEEAVVGICFDKLCESHGCELSQRNGAQLYSPFCVSSIVGKLMQPHDELLQLARGFNGAPIFQVVLSMASRMRPLDGRSAGF